MKVNEKIRINIGTIGHVDHGKTTLTAALTAVTAKFYPGLKNKQTRFDEIDKAPEEKARGITINTTTVRYETPKAMFNHGDCPGHRDLIRNMVVGATQMDWGILVIDSNTGPQPQTKEHIGIMKQCGVSPILFLNKIDTGDEGLHELAEEEAKELLVQYGFDMSKVLCFKGSALKALEGDAHYEQILIQMLDDIVDKMPHPIRIVDAPFKMAIDKGFSIKGRGTVVTGSIESGRVKLNDPVQLIGVNNNCLDTTVIGVETFKETLDSAQAGDNIGILLRGVNLEQVDRGMILCSPNTVKTHKIVKAEIFTLSTKEGGRHTPIQTGYRPQFFVRTGDFTGQITLKKGLDFLLPGDNSEIMIVFENAIPIEVKQRLIIREGGRTIGAGIVISILSSESEMSEGV